MIVRKHYRGTLKQEENKQEKIEALLKLDRDNASEAVQQGRCLTVALYRHEQMIFLYVETLDEELTPQELFPRFTQSLELWPERKGKMPWSPMHHIYYHAIPESVEQWAREGKKTRRGRIALLLEDKLFSYVYHHQAIVDEGLLEGDQYQSIALHGDILFSYFEEPRMNTHIKKEIKEPSQAINHWLAVDPESHFDHEFSGKGNFRFIEELFSIGREDL